MLTAKSTTYQNFNTYNYTGTITYLSEEWIIELVYLSSFHCNGHIIDADICFVVVEHSNQTCPVSILVQNSVRIVWAHNHRIRKLQFLLNHREELKIKSTKCLQFLKFYVASDVTEIIFKLTFFYIRRKLKWLAKERLILRLNKMYWTCEFVARE